MSISKLYTCMEKKKVNQSQAREAIYRVLMEAHNECMTVADIMEALPKVYAKKISLNTIYRHLNLFISCKLAVMIQDDFKKSYFCLTGEEPLAFIVCTKCNHIEKCSEKPKNIMDGLESTDFVTIHKRCLKCK